MRLFTSGKPFGFRNSIVAKCTLENLCYEERSGRVLVLDNIKDTLTDIQGYVAILTSSQST